MRPRVKRNSISVYHSRDLFARRFYTRLVLYDFSSLYIYMYTGSLYFPCKTYYHVCLIVCLSRGIYFPGEPE